MSDSWGSLRNERKDGGQYPCQGGWKGSCPLALTGQGGLPQRLLLGFISSEFILLQVGAQGWAWRPTIGILVLEMLRQEDC